MSKTSTKKRGEESPQVENERNATATAPVASTAASETSTVAVESTGDDSTSNVEPGTLLDDGLDSASLEAGREARAADIAVAGKTAEPAKPKKESFVINADLRTRLHSMTNIALLDAARDKLKPVELADSRVFIVDRSHGLTDRIVGSDLSRSGIRSAVVDFLSSRDEEQAPGWAIASYMHLAAGESGVGVYKGKFDLGYLAARGRDVRRGMISRGQLKFGDHDIAAPGTEPKAPTTEAVADEKPKVEDAIADTGVDKELPIQEDVAPETTPATETED